MEHKARAVKAVDRHEGVVNSTVRIEPHQTLPGLVVEAGGGAGHQYFAIGLQSHGDHGIVRAGAGLERGVHAAGGIEACDAPEVGTVELGEAAADDDLPIGLQGHGAYDRTNVGPVPALNVLSTAPKASRRTTPRALVPFTVWNDPQTKSLPCGCNTMSEMPLEGPVPTLKEGSKVPSALSRANRMALDPETVVNQPPTITLPLVRGMALSTSASGPAPGSKDGSMEPSGNNMATRLRGTPLIDWKPPATRMRPSCNNVMLLTIPLAPEPMLKPASGVPSALSRISRFAVTSLNLTNSPPTNTFPSGCYTKVNTVLLKPSPCLKPRSPGLKLRSSVPGWAEAWNAAIRKATSVSRGVRHGSIYGCNKDARRRTLKQQRRRPRPDRLPRFQV